MKCIGELYIEVVNIPVLAICQPWGQRDQKGLLRILFSKIGVILEQLLAIRICPQNLQDAADCNSHPANAGMAAHLGRLDCNAVEWRIGVHRTIMPRRSAHAV